MLSRRRGGVERREGDKNKIKANLDKRVKKEKI